MTKFIVVILFVLLTGCDGDGRKQQRQAEIEKHEKEIEGWAIDCSKVGVRTFTTHTCNGSQDEKINYYMQRGWVIEAVISSGFREQCFVLKKQEGE